jgi:transposase
MDRTERRAARARFLEAIEAGASWQEGARQAGLPLKRSAAYQLRCRMRLEGPQALDDRRQGHPSKCRTEVRTWLEQTCRAQPHRPGWQLQHYLVAQFGITVSVSQINRLRATLGVRYQRPQKRS